jgi:hypothetical protein
MVHELTSNASPLGPLLEKRYVCRRRKRTWHSLCVFFIYIPEALSRRIASTSAVLFCRPSCSRWLMLAHDSPTGLRCDNTALQTHSPVASIRPPSGPPTGGVVAPGFRPLEPGVPWQREYSLLKERNAEGDASVVSKLSSPDQNNLEIPVTGSPRYAGERPAKLVLPWNCGWPAPPAASNNQLPLRQSAIQARYLQTSRIDEYDLEDSDLCSSRIPSRIFCYPRSRLSPSLNSSRLSN